MPKKRLQDELKEGKAVDTQAVAAEIQSEINERNEELAAPKGGLAPKNGGLVAYAAFDCNGEHYEPGDEFTPPAGWTRDANYDEFRGVQIKNATKSIGIAFNLQGEIINKKTGERAQYRQIVPVKEA